MANAASGFAIFLYSGTSFIPPSNLQAGHYLQPHKMNFLSLVSSVCAGEGLVTCVNSVFSM